MKDLDKSLNAGYALMEDQGAGQYRVILGKGALYDVAARTGETLKLKESNKTQLYQVAGATVGKQNVYAIVKPLSLYSNNVPYEDACRYCYGQVPENGMVGRICYMDDALCSIMVETGIMKRLYLLDKTGLERVVS